MKIYHYHFETGQYLGEGLADPSPLEEDVWLIPAWATEIEPPKVKDNEHAFFIDNEWSIYTAANSEIINETQESTTPPINLENFLSNMIES
jgi:hypothetical protein